ncbi:diguanylate cyclase domain-containing protein [Caldimonas brevitalea]|uniref:Diguanylate cyclase/phosphodiesterase n=1 Tax=Caldimonas brevitalea TaxID=413882 RepID=A0A0G3BR51_9BURK|nr:diguanylate cyclase [Caldimonas brevitalea]AKJ31902.1 diguanylate cyclase/phosphodiesterase [Caldimonas brevitalea]
MKNLLQSHPMSLRQLAFWLVAGNIVMAALLMAATWLALDSSATAHADRARQATENLADSLSAEIGAELKQIDNALATVALQAQRASSNAGERRMAIERSLVEQRALIPQVDAMRATDAEGRVVYGVAGGTRPVSLADRDYFKAAAAGATSLVVSEPLQGRILRDWGIILARRLQDGDGRFAGVVYTNLSTAHFMRQFKRFALGSTGAISLRSKDMRLVARYSAREPDSTKGVGTISVSPELQRLLALQPTHGWYRTRTALDGIERITAYRQVPGGSMTVMAGLATEDFLAAWRQQVSQQVALVSGVIVALAGFSVAIFRQHRRAHAARSELARLAAEQHVMLDNELIGMAKIKDRKIVWKNRAMERLFGYEGGELLGASTRQLFQDEAAYVEKGKLAAGAMREGGSYRAQVRMRHKSGRSLWVDLAGANLPQGESLWLMADISALKASEETAQHLALHDALTGLANRLLFKERLEYILADSKRSGKTAAVCYLDLDGFKEVNDGLGHDAGDAVLREVAARMSACVRANDVIARLGGDEFGLVLTHLGEAGEADVVLHRLVDAVGQPVALPDGSFVTVGASIGVALTPNHGNDVATLMKLADGAMYRSKKTGKGRISVHGQE